MGLFRANGERVTRANVATADVDDPLVEVTEDLFETKPYAQWDPKPEGTIRTLKLRAGAVMRESELDLLFQQAKVAQVVPGQGPAAGGTVVTIKGTGLDGVTAVSFDGAAGTNLNVVSSTEVRVTTPAGVAGPADVQVTDDGGPVTLPGGFTYT